MSTLGWDLRESNKENIPFDHYTDEKPQVHQKDASQSHIDVNSATAIVLPPLPVKHEKRVSQPDDVDVVTVSEEHMLSPSLSQNSNFSAMSTPSQSFSLARHSSDEMDGADSEDGETTSRKEKSLGLLCQRFLIAMNEETRVSMTREVHLETVARKMNVEKRRIYDIVNVMEALDAMSKTNKSFYRWHGLTDLPRLMHELQREAVRERLPERVLRVEQAMCSFTELSPGSRQTAGSIVGSLLDDSPILASPSSSSSSTVPCDSRKSRVDGRDKMGRNSLAQLCRRFLMVLLSNPKNTRRVSLDVASTVLIKDPETEGFEPPSRSRCRRLYDIANVLVALGLIKKVHYLFGTKKIPLFVYCGPEPDEHAKYDANACLEKMLTSSTSAPQTPQMKATTAAMVHSLSLGKRSQSDANFASTIQAMQKMPRIKSEDFVVAASSSLMMFAELAAERLRQESHAHNDVTRRQNDITTGNGPANTENVLPKPQPQLFRSHFSSPMSPLNARRFSPKQLPNPYQMTSLPMVNLQPIVLPRNPVWTPANPMRTTPIISSPLTNSAPVLKAAAPKHTVSNILGNSNRLNVSSSLDHKHTSPFQVVKRNEQPVIPKLPFGALHNLQGRF